MHARLITSLGAVCLGLMFATSPAAAQGTASSVCTDGTTSTVTGRGACSGHGGVDSKATAKLAKSTKAAAKADKAAAKADAKTAAATGTKTDAKADKAAQKSVTKTASADASDNNAAGATASCKDGTYSHAKSHRGACSGHGGVAKFLK